MKAALATAAAAAALIGTVFGGVQVADSRYVQVSQFAQYAVEDFYDKFYEAEDRKIAAEASGDEKAAREAQRDMERLKAKICDIDPKWERCD